MNLNDCIRRARDEMLSTGDKLTTAQIFDRALEINGAQDEFEARSLEKARREWLRVTRRMLDEVTEAEIAPDDPNAGLMQQLPGMPAPMAVALPAEDGEVAYKAYAATTDADLEANDQILTENIERAQRKREDRREKRDALAAYRTDSDATTIDALREMERRNQGAA